MALGSGVGMKLFLPTPFPTQLGQTGSATAFEQHLQWHWDWPLWLSVAAAVAVGLWVSAIYFRESCTGGTGFRLLLVFLRLIAVAIVAIMLSQPTREWLRQGRPRLLVLVDRSASMQTPEMEEPSASPRSRLELVKEVLASGEDSLLASWQEGYEIEIVCFDEHFQVLPPGADSLAEQILQLQVGDSQKGTRLGEAIDYALRELPGLPPTAIVLFTDGLSNRGTTLNQAAQIGRRLQVPIYTIAIGSEQPRADIAVEELLVEEVVFPGDRLQVEVSVKATGFTGQDAEILLRHGDSKEVLSRTELELPPDGRTKRVLLSTRPEKPGSLPLEVLISPRESELNRENNLARQVVDVSDQKLRVLVLQSQPSFEYRALKSMLERDPAVELSVYLQEADADYATVDDAALRKFPATEPELFRYDVLLLGDADLDLLPQSVWPLLDKFVIQHGGGLVAIAGPRYMPLAYRDVPSLQLLLPIELADLNPLRSQFESSRGLTVFPTVLGWRTPSLQLGETQSASEDIWQGLPPVRWLLRVDQLKSGAQVLAEHPGTTSQQGQPLPVIIRQYVGAGEVLFHATDETWRWRRRSDDRYFARYWGQTVRRLGRGRLSAGRQGVLLTSDRKLYLPNESIMLLVRFRNPMDAPIGDSDVVIQLEGPTGPAREVALQQRVGRRETFSATIDGLPPGNYQATLVRPALSDPIGFTSFEIRQPAAELTDLATNRQGLAEVAKLTGGKTYTFATASRLKDELPLPKRQAVDQLPPEPLWNSNWLMAVFVTALASEWLLRRRCGML